MERIKALTLRFFQGADLDNVQDGQLVSMAAKGQNEAFKVLYLRHNDLLYRFLYRILLNEEVTKEVIQETWMKIHKNSHCFDGQASFKTWLYTIGKNTAFDRLKKRSESLYDDPQSVEELSIEEETALEGLVREATRERVRKALEFLNIDQKTVLAMWMEDVSINEMSEVMERTPQAIKNLIHRSKKKLKSILEGNEHE